MVTVSTLATAIAAPEAFAISLVPQEEGEVDVGFGCDGSCIDLPNMIASVESLVDTEINDQSRLFVRDLSFLPDLGTNGDGFWFRPVNDNEGGNQEVGTYRFNFTQAKKKVAVDFLDVESNNSTGVLAVNDLDLDPAQYAPKLPDGSISTMIFEDVESITLKLGKVFPNGAADGVNFRIRAIPEPSVVLGLGLVAATAGLGLRKGKNS